MFVTINKFNEGAKKVRELALAGMVRDFNPETTNFAVLAETIKFVDTAIELITKQAKVIDLMDKRLSRMENQMQDIENAVKNLKKD